MRLHRVLFAFVLSGMTVQIAEAANPVLHSDNLANVPLEDAALPEPNVVILMDNSGSMDWNLMTEEIRGQFVLSPFMGLTHAYRYLYPLPTDISDLDRLPTEEALDNNPLFVDNEYGVWRGRSAAYNRVYYNPQTRYLPWAGTDDAGNTFTDADPTAVRFTPFQANSQVLDLTVSYSWISDAVPLPSDGTPVDVSNQSIYLPYYWTATSSAGSPPNFEERGVKITIDGNLPITLNGGGTSNAYPGGAMRSDCAVDDGDPTTCTFEQELQNFANWFAYYRNRQSTAKSALGQVTFNANGVRVGYAALNNPLERLPLDSLNESPLTGHRKNLLDQIYSASSGGSSPLRSGLDQVGRYYECLAGDIFGSASDSNPGDVTCAALAAPAGQCQANFTLLVTDGGWNGTLTGSAADNHDALSAQSPFDGGMFGDTYVGTLGDVAMYYYKRDLQPGLADEVVATARDRDWSDVTAFPDSPALMHQHMKTYTVGLGVSGSVELEDLPALDGNSSTNHETPFSWPDPLGSVSAKIDDLLHAAVNSRSEYQSANDPVALAAKMQSAFDAFGSGSASAGTSTFSSGSLRSGTVEYRGFYDLETNSGDLIAFAIDPGTGRVDRSDPLWSAAAVLDGTSPNSRRLVTFDRRAGYGIGFQAATLNADQQLILNADQVDWIRGTRSQEEQIGVLRSRPQSRGLLGDIVHSAPQFVGAPRALGRDQSPYPSTSGKLYSQFVQAVSGRNHVVYVGANDGILHGFDAGDPNDQEGTGAEVFGYVPNKLIDGSQMFANTLDGLTAPTYGHRFFVDLTPTVEDAFVKPTSVGQSAWQTILVGGLGGGGKGYFALNITNPNTSFATQGNAAATVMWEFTDADDTYPTDASGAPLTDDSGGMLLDVLGNPAKDLGFSYSEPQVVMSNIDDGGEKAWVTIFGNGRNSSAGIAKLFVLFINKGFGGWADGDFVKLDTGAGVLPVPEAMAGLPNGLGMPAIIDTDANGTADRAYAGDLFGNLYRFDISSSDVDDWSVTRIFQATYDETATTRQPITTRPFVQKHPSGVGFLVVFGTGSYVTTQDGSSQELQSLYGIWDADESSPRTDDMTAKGEFLVEQVITNVVDEDNANFPNQRIVSANPVEYAQGADGVYGWYIDFDMVRATGTLQGSPNPNTEGQNPPDPQYPGERAIRRFIAIDQELLVTTIIPRVDSSCFESSPGSLFPIDILTGGNPKRAILDLNNDKRVDQSDLLNYDGIDYAAGVLFDPSDLDGTLVDPSRLLGTDLDFIVVNGGDDRVTLGVVGFIESKSGRLSWRELTNDI
ncbi:MAG: PilC/PilY family type IV pilus protein [Proteobacteria bacterium]|nr:PilC/PilY family type IV pilus protein [Pseudomonadota bacterium]